MTIPYAATQALEYLQLRLASVLRAVYLHGSAVSGGLHPHSDIDLLVIIQQPMAIKLRQVLINDLLAISGHYPSDPEGRRPLEVIIFSEDDLVSTAYPARCELIYGEWLRNDYEQGHPSTAVCDPDITLVLANAREQAVALYGPSLCDLLPPVSPVHICKAIKGALPALIKSLSGDERNVILTLARMWYTVETGQFASKSQAGEWAAARLPTEQADILNYARHAYLQRIEEDWRNRQPSLLCTVQSLSEQITACDDC